MNPTCKQCGQREVEDARVCYATPVCFACLPPPLPLNAAWSLSAVWMAAMAEVLEHVRHEDGAPETGKPWGDQTTECRDDWSRAHCRYETVVAALTRLAVALRLRPRQPLEMAVAGSDDEDPRDGAGKDNTGCDV